MRWLALLCLLVSGCGLVGPSVAGSGNVTKTDREVAEFQKISFAGFGRISIVSGAESASCQVQVDDNLQEYIETSVKDGELVIRFRDHVNINPTESVEIQVSTAKLTSLELAGAANADVSGLAETDSLAIEGAGSTEITCSGAVEKLTVELAGSGKLLARELTAKDIELEIAGAGSAELHATDNLKVNVAGSGNVRYLGNPKISQSIAGAGKVEKLEN